MESCDQNRSLKRANLPKTNNYSQGEEARARRGRREEERSVSQKSGVGGATSFTLADQSLSAGFLSSLLLLAQISNTAMGPRLVVSTCTLTCTAESSPRVVEVSFLSSPRTTINTASVAGYIYTVSMCERILPSRLPDRNPILRHNNRLAKGTPRLRCDVGLL